MGCAESTFDDKATYVPAKSQQAELAGKAYAVIGSVKDGTDLQKFKAANMLDDLATNNTDNKVMIGEIGGIPPLVALLRPSVSDIHVELAGIAAFTLLHLVDSKNTEQNVQKIVDANGIPLLVKLLSVGPSCCTILPGAPTSAIAAQVLFRISMGDYESAIVEAGGIPPLVALLQSGTNGAKFNACRALNNLMSEDKIGERIVVAGGIPLLVALLKSSEDILKAVATMALARLSAGVDNHQLMIAASGAVPPLMEMLKDQKMQAEALTLLFMLAQNETLLASKDGLFSVQTMGQPLLAIIEEGRTEEVFGFECSVATLAAVVLHRLVQDTLKETPDEETLAPITTLFKRIDQNGNGRISRAEIIKTVRSDAEVREALGLPAKIGEEQRGELETVFQDMDKDDSREVDFAEFANFIFRKNSMPFEIKNTTNEDATDEDATYKACMRMRVSELKAELDLRKKSYEGVMEKDELARMLADARSQGSP